MEAFLHKRIEELQAQLEVCFCCAARDLYPTAVTVRESENDTKLNHLFRSQRAVCEVAKIPKQTKTSSLPLIGCTQRVRGVVGVPLFRIAAFLSSELQLGSQIRVCSMWLFLLRNRSGQRKWRVVVGLFHGTRGESTTGAELAASGQ